MWLDRISDTNAEIPRRLKGLVEAVPANPGEMMVEVAVHYEDPYGSDWERVLMQTAVIPEARGMDFHALRRADFNVVSHSTQVADHRAMGKRHLLADQVVTIKDRQSSVFNGGFWGTSTRLRLPKNTARRPGKMSCVQTLATEARPAGRGHVM